jgi:hypothetical protein
VGKLSHGHQSAAPRALRAVTAARASHGTEAAKQHADTYITRGTRRRSVPVSVHSLHKQSASVAARTVPRPQRLLRPSHHATRSVQSVYFARACDRWEWGFNHAATQRRQATPRQGEYRGLASSAAHSPAPEPHATAMDTAATAVHVPAWRQRRAARARHRRRQHLPAWSRPKARPLV